MASWGKAKLSSAALREIRSVNDALTEDHITGIRGELLRDVLAAEEESPKPFGLLMDFPTRNAPSSIQAEEKPSEAIEVHGLATKVADIVRNGQSSINVVIDMVSKVTHGAVDDLVKECWSLLDEDEHKKSFVVAMSTTRTTALSVSSNILLPLLTSPETFQPSIQLYGPVFGWLEGSFPPSAVVPLLLNEHSVINQDPVSCKTLINNLSEIQKTDAIVIFCQSVPELHERHLQSLCLILETPPIDSSVVQPVTQLLNKHISLFSEDRSVGKIILMLISLLSASPTHQLYSELADLAAQFKGPLRFRHKQALSKVSKQIES